MLAILEWAAEQPKRWHDIGKMPESRKAAELFAKRASSRFGVPPFNYAEGVNVLSMCAPFLSMPNTISCPTRSFT